MSTLNVDLFIDFADDLSKAYLESVPNQGKLELCLLTALKQIKHDKSVELTIRVVSMEESNQLNLTYRNQDKATNVLSFPVDLPDFIESNHIGDIAVCAQVLIQEAASQGKTIEAHWTHLCVHGLLHLLGYDHASESEATEMEAIEVATLSALGIDDPYQVR